MKEHRLKTHPKYFQYVRAGLKTFELRKNDRDYEVRDELVLEEYYPGIFDGGYTGQIERRRIGYILEHASEYGLSDDYCILGFTED